MLRTGTLMTALAVLAVAAACGESPTPTPLPTPWPVTASVLWAEGEGNATRYDYSWKGGRVTVSGTITRIEDWIVYLDAADYDHDGDGEGEAALSDLPAGVVLVQNAGVEFTATCTVGDYVRPVVHLHDCERYEPVRPPLPTATPTPSFALRGQPSPTPADTVVPTPRATVNSQPTPLSTATLPHSESRPLDLWDLELTSDTTVREVIEVLLPSDAECLRMAFGPDVFDEAFTWLGPWLDCLSPATNAGIGFAVTAARIRPTGLSADSKACLREVFAEHGELFAPGNNVSGRLTEAYMRAALCLSDEESEVLPAWDEYFPPPSVLRCLAAEFGGFEQFFEAYTNEGMNSENDRAMFEAFRTCEFDLGVDAGQADPPTPVSPPLPTATPVTGLLRGRPRRFPSDGQK